MPEWRATDALQDPRVILRELLGDGFAAHRSGRALAVELPLNSGSVSNKYKLMSKSSVEANVTSFTIRVLRYDGTEYRHWNAQLARRDGSLIVLKAEFDVEVRHLHLGHIPLGTRTIEYYWQDRWYNVFEFLDDEGETRLWYCNVNLPPIVEEASITYVDLDLDLIVQTDFSYQVLDSDEFEHHAQIFGYSQEVQESARKALAELISMIQRRQFPFNERKK